MEDIRPTLKEIAHRIARRRKELGMTQAALAERLGKSRAYVIALEGGAGEAQPTVTVLYELADVFGCTVPDLLPARPLREERPPMRGAAVTARAEEAVAAMLEEARNGRG